MSPVVLFRAATVPSSYPGQQINLSPSTSGDSFHAQLDITRPLKSLTRFFCQRTAPPAASRQARSPMTPRTYTAPPSTVGVHRGPVPYGAAIRVELDSRASGVRQTSLPVA